MDSDESPRVGGGGKFFDKRVPSGFTNRVIRVRYPLVGALLGALGFGLGQPSSAAPDTASPRAPEPPGAEAAAPPSSGAATAVDDARRPVFSQALLRYRTRAQERILGRDQAVEDEFGRVVPARQIVLDDGKSPPAKNGNELGHFVPIENEPALAHFHQALEELQREPEAKSKVRVAVYGASHTQADIYSGYLRYYLQSRFGNGGLGFVPLGTDRGWAHRLDFKVKGRGFKVQYAQKRSVARGGRFGLAGAAAVAGPHAWARISPDNNTDPDLTASQYGLFYAAEPEGGDIAVSVDGDEPVELPTRAAQLEPRYHTFERTLGWHQVEIRTLGSGSARLFGLSVERAQPGLVIDTMGIRGTRAANMLLWDQALWEEHVRRRAPDLVLLAYGTNESTDRGQPIAEYSSELSRVLSRIRQALPEVSCVLVGPGDFPKAEGDTWIPRPRLLEIIHEQRRLAPEFGCGFWNTYEFMGGEGSMSEWASSIPRMGSQDHIHLTARGYVRMGMVLGDALMRAYDARHLPSDLRVASGRISERTNSASQGAAAAASP